MEEKHIYRSKLQYKSSRHNLLELHEEILKYLKNNTEKVFAWHPKPKDTDIYGFHLEGISIHFQSKYSNITRDYSHIDIRLISNVTPTISLEEKLDNLAKKHIVE